jgi:hypothetical protein
MGFCCAGIEVRLEAVEEARAAERTDGADVDGRAEVDGFAAKAVDRIEGDVIEDETEVVGGAAGLFVP